MVIKHRYQAWTYPHIFTGIQILLYIAKAVHDLPANVSERFNEVVDFFSYLTTGNTKPKNIGTQPCYKMANEDLRGNGWGLSLT